MNRLKRSHELRSLGFVSVLSCFVLFGAVRAETLEEIVVTATKRQQVLQDVPMSITVFGRDQLEDMGASDFIDYASKTPNLGFGADADGRFDSRKFGIRGVFSAGQATIGGTTGLYIDEIPIPETMNPKLVDLERIEVLRGPQGSLYGARSMGGTIRMISASPDFVNSSFRGRTAISSVDEGGANWTVDGAANLPLADNKVALHVMGYLGEDSGVQDRIVAPGSPGPSFNNEDVDSESYYGAQVSAAMALNENISITPRLIYQSVEADGLPFADYEPGNFKQVRNFDLSEAGSDEFYIASATLDWQFDSGNLTSVTGYMEREVYEDEDETLLLTYFFGTPPIPSIITQDLNFNAFLHETRFTSAFDGPFQLSAGLFIQDTEQNVVFPPATAEGLDEAFSELIGVPYPPGALGTDLIYTTDGDFDTQEIAVFFEASYDASDRVTVTVGGRYSDSEINYHVTADGLANGGFSEITGDNQENQFSPKFLVDFDLNDDVRLYATAAEGFRIGGVNGNVPPTLCADDLIALGNPSPESLSNFDSDSLWSYEVGVKSMLANNKVMLNAAAFVIDWSDVIQVVRLSCGFQYFANAGGAEINGFEFEMRAQPSDGLDITFGVGRADATFKDITNEFAGVENGDRVQQVPEWTVTASGQYSFPFGSNDKEWFLRGDYAYQSDSLSANNEVSNPRVRPSWSLLNLRTGFSSGRWVWTLFVDNATNEHINLADNKSLAAEYPGRPRIVTNRPRTVGIEVRFR